MAHSGLSSWSEISQLGGGGRMKAPSCFRFSYWIHQLENPCNTGCCCRSKEAVHCERALEAEMKMGGKMRKNATYSECLGHC